jgi:hypothetical protein
LSTIPASLRALLSNLIDYAGLFPPAGLRMQEAVDKYSRYLAGPDAWALGRFVLPVSRFAEFEAAFVNVNPVEPWAISALLGTSHESDLAAVHQFNLRNARKARVDSVEVKATSVHEICQVRALIRGTLTPYYEIAPDKSSGLLPAIRDIHGRAKIRTGGVTADAFPSSQAVARFLMECEKYNVPFKATAGLHHPLRCVKPLTYEPDAPTHVMHGFLNLFIAAVFAWAGGKTFEVTEPFFIHGRPMRTPFPIQVGKHDERSLIRTLQSIRSENKVPFKFNETGMEDPYPIPAAIFKAARKNFAISFGSCSFEEPLADLRELKIL